MKASMIFAFALVLFAASCQAQPASPVQNAVLAQLQGGSTDGTQSGTSSSGVFSSGLSGSNAAQLVSYLKGNITAAAPSVRQTVLSTLSQYNVSAPAPAPALLAQLKGLPANTQESLFSDLLSELVTPASAPAQQTTPTPNTNTVGFGDGSGNGQTSSSGSNRKLLK